MKVPHNSQSILVTEPSFSKRISDRIVASSFRYFLLAISVALLIGLAFFARQIIGIEISGNKYTPLVYNQSSLSTTSSIKSDYNFKPDDILWDETRAYARYTQEVIRGEFLGANAASFNPYLKEGSFPKIAWYRDRLGPIILAGMTKIFGSISNAFVASDFIFPFLIALILMLLCRNFFGFTIGFSVIATASTMFLSWSDLLHLRDILLGQLPDGLVLLRTPYPQFTFLTFLIFTLTLINFHRKPSYQALAWIGIITLVNFYMYFYVWTIVFVMMGLYAVINSHDKLSMLFLNSKHQYRWSFWLTLIMVVAFSYPVWGALAHGHSTFNDTFLRVFGQYSHAPEWHQSLLVLPFLILATVFRNPSWSTRWVWLIFFASALIALNQQIITGKINQPGHWTSQLIEPLTVLFLFDFAFNYFRKIPIARNIILISVPLIIVAVAAQIYFVSYRGAVVAAPYNRIDSQFSEIIHFMNQARFRNDGFLSNDPYLRTVLPAYIAQKPLMPWYNDPLSNKDIDLINAALTKQFGSMIGLSNNQVNNYPSNLKFDESKVILILNRRLENFSQLVPCQILLENEDFIVATPQKCKN